MELVRTDRSRDELGSLVARSTFSPSRHPSCALRAVAGLARASALAARRQPSPAAISAPGRRVLLVAPPHRGVLVRRVFGDHDEGMSISFAVHDPPSIDDLYRRGADGDHVHGPAEPTHTLGFTATARVFRSGEMATT